MTTREAALRGLARQYGQDHVFQFWETLDRTGRDRLLTDLEQVDFPLMRRLAEHWVLAAPEPEHFETIRPVPVIPVIDPSRADAQTALAAGEEALRAGRVGLFLVAGGQGTRLGFEGPKGAYPIGPVSKKSFFAFHAEKIHNLQRRYECVLPWYIMVSDTNEAETRAFFEGNNYFDLRCEDIFFLKQRMVPCVDESGKFMLDQPDRLAMNPNGHGGAIPAMVENQVIANARGRGIDILSYFQVDNWAVKVADPCFIGYHILHRAEMSSKSHRKHQPREAVGVHCLCDGEYRVIEYSELDLYPQLLETDEQGHVVYYAGNPAIHVISVDFIERVYRDFEHFPWHRAHKQVPFIDQQGKRVEPEEPNAYKFETFIFDALRFTQHPPIALEIDPPGEYTPIKSFSGDNSVERAWAIMRDYWAQWLEAAGYRVPRDEAGRITIAIEISPAFALTREEFLEKPRGRSWPETGDIAIDADGNLIGSKPAN
ncbi:MAG: UTP--glucose-1-phosphate uridylyltransferase [Candidatus Hydrogenedentes bacterium]|nr:UTP--glucose-1-phosphate uridylyltransferase [Candidatus Hydrogenedentota bacterium]